MSTVNSSKEDFMQEQILTAAKTLFQVHGFAKVTMDDVAKAIGKGRSSLYYYYKSKDEIFDAVLTIEIREMLTAMTQAVDRASGTEQKLLAFFLTKLEVLGEKRAFFKMLDVGMDANTLSDFNKAKIVHHHFIMSQEGRLLQSLLTEGMDKNELRRMEGSELEMLIYVLLTSQRGLKRELELENDAEKLVPAVNMLTRVTMNGLYK